MKLIEILKICLAISTLPFIEIGCTPYASEGDSQKFPSSNLWGLDTIFNSNNSTIEVYETKGGIKHGAFREYSPSWKLLTIGQYSEGKRNGTWTYSHKDGSFWAMGNYYYFEPKDTIFSSSGSDNIPWDSVPEGTVFTFDVPPGPPIHYFKDSFHYEETGIWFEWMSDSNKYLITDYGKLKD